MNRLNNFFLVLLILIGAASLHAQTQTPITVYTGVCGSQYYRIPAIVTASNGDLLFFNDDRKDNNSDVGRRGSNQNGIDLLVKRLPYNTTSQSYSTTFSSPLNITPSSTKTSGSYCYGDPAVVADRESGEVLVLTIGGAGASSGLWTGNKTSFAIKSTDNGQKWGAPVQLSLPTVTTYGSSVAGFFFASGRILQSKVIKNQGANYYRIYSAILAHESSGSNYNKVFYSDDFGTTWYLLGSGNAQSSADEAKLEELPNGDLILTTRKGGGRYINKYTYANTETAAGSWGSFGQSYAFTGGCAINADMLTMTAYRKSDNQQVTLLLLSTATGTPDEEATSYAKNGRYDIKIFYHEIDNNTTVANLTSSGWAVTSFTLPNTSVFGGYSAMTLQADDKIGVYYEGNTSLCASAGNDFSNLYYIAYTLEQLTGNAYTLTDPNPPVVVVPDVEVPDGVVPVYEWHGTNSPYWNDPLNWTVVNAVNNAPLARATVPTLPATNSNVKILKPSAGEYNPVLTTATSVANLYVAPGAALGGQHYLTITGRVFTDVEIPSNQWVRMCMPLSNTYSGDMFTATQGGKILNGNGTTVLTPDDEDYYFTGATYDPVDGGGDNAHNRKFPYSIYQRVFADAVNVMNDDIPDETRQLNSEWSVPYNDLAARFQDAQGFDLWSPSTESISMFRFPSVTDNYQYYTNNGTPHTTRSETVNHTMSGTMAYGASNNGVKDVTITRNKRSEGTGEAVPMYAVGNPSFAYMDIAEFIRVNAYGASHQGDASVVGNITPYVYKYNEDNPGSTGEAGETIYYLDNDKKLYTVSPTSVSDNTIPTGGTTTQVAANSTEKYVAPTRGFRVMAGQAEVSAVEPKLIGNYSTSDFKIAPMRYGTTTALTGGTNTYSYISSLAPNSTGEYTTTLTISLGSSPDEIIMNGFCVSNVLVGKVNPVDQTITVKGGSVVGWQTDNANWTTPANTSSYTGGKRPTNRHIYAWDGTSRSTTSERIGPSNKYYYTQYASNLSADNDIVFDYTIASDGQIQITCRSGFAIYTIADNNATVNNVSSRDYPISYLMVEYDDKTVTGYNYPLTFNVYESFSAATTRTTTEESYICPEMFGTYKYLVTGIDGAESGITKNSEHSFNILPIEGAYDVVRITDFYAGTGTTYSHDGILGYITPSGSTYTLTIPSAQVVAYGSTGDFGQFKTLYKRLTGATTRSSDPSILTWNAASKVFTIQNYNTTTDKGSFQVSMYDGNGGAYYANGFSGTTTTQPVAVTVSQASELSVTPLLLCCKGNSSNQYLGANASGSLEHSNIVPDLTGNQFRLSLERQSDGTYKIKNSVSNSKPYLSATNGWVNSNSSTSFVVDFVGSNGWTIKSGNQYLTFFVSGSKATLSLSNDPVYWSIFKVVNQSVFTTGTSAGQYIPRTAQYTPGASGNTGNPTFSVGSNYEAINYEAINLKFTPLMFEANPGNNQSASSAPRKTAAQGSTMASVTLKDGNRTANTLITRRDNANNGYNAFEDASLIDMADNAKSIATLAGNQMVAVNTLGDTTAVQLVINNVSGNFTLDVDNISALGSNARLYDAVNATEQPIDGNHQTLTLNMSVNDSPLRYSIRWDVATGTEDIELPNGNSDVWFQAFGGNGTIRVNSNNVMSQVRLFDAAGKEIARRSNQGYETSFNALQPGVYMVEATDGQTTKTIKVSVK